MKTEFWRILGTAKAHFGRGELEEASTLCRAILAENPRYAGALHLLGAIHHNLGDHEEAVELIAQAVDEDPGDPTWTAHLAEALMAQGRYEAAMARLNEALVHAPGNAGLASAMAMAVKHTRGGAAALPWFSMALGADPNSASTLNNLGNTLTEIGRPEEAWPFLKRVTELAPTWPDGFNNLGFCLYEQGRPKDCLAPCEQAFTMKPDHVEAHINHANALLALGRLAEGWTEYEWRWHRPKFKPRPFKQPWWKGENIKGKTLLLHAEQGFGDTLVSVRFASLVKERGARVIMEVPKALHPLLANLEGCDEVLKEGDKLPAFDLHCPLMSLPLALDITLETIPAPIPYLRPDPKRVKAWQKKLPKSGLKVGLAWQGNPGYVRDAVRSFSAADLTPFGEIEGVTFVNLLKSGEKRETLSFPVIDFGDDLDRDAPFLDTLAVMESLDLVIAVDTALAHLAGAAGRPTWLALNRGCYWRWMQGRSDSPWYPTMRLFRQTHQGQWQSVVEEMVAELACLARTC